MIADIGLFMLPYVIVLAIGYVLGFLVRSRTIDRLQADLIKVRAERDGIEIRTSRPVPGTEPVRPVQPRTAAAGTARPAYAPHHAPTRTEPLPTGMRYVTAEGTTYRDDEPVTDTEYADMMRATFADD